MLRISGIRVGIYSDPTESLVVEVVNINNNCLLKNNNLTTTTDSSLDGKIPTVDAIQKVLDAAENLFDHEILGDPRDYWDIDRLLAWICQAYHLRGDGRGKVSSPAGLVYWAFHQGKDQKPRKKYYDLDNADRFLPESFMRASGQWNFVDRRPRWMINEFICMESLIKTIVITGRLLVLGLGKTMNSGYYGIDGRLLLVLLNTLLGFLKNWWIFHPIINNQIRPMNIISSRGDIISDHERSGECT